MSTSVVFLTDSQLTSFFFHFPQTSFTSSLSRLLLSFSDTSNTLLALFGFGAFPPLLVPDIHVSVNQQNFWQMNPVLLCTWTYSRYFQNTENYFLLNKCWDIVIPGLLLKVFSCSIYWKISITASNWSGCVTCCESDQHILLTQYIKVWKKKMLFNWKWKCYPLFFSKTRNIMC